MSNSTAFDVKCLFLDIFSGDMEATFLKNSPYAEKPALRREEQIMGTPTLNKLCISGKNPLRPIISAVTAKIQRTVRASEDRASAEGAQSHFRC